MARILTIDGDTRYGLQKMFYNEAASWVIVFYVSVGTIWINRLVNSSLYLLVRKLSHKT